MSAGLLTTWTPAAVSAAIFSAAVPLPPAIIAPACPIRRPGGRVFLGRTPDLADHDDRIGFVVCLKQLERVDIHGADQRVAADADAG
jgi:hypothetical protein